MKKIVYLVICVLFATVSVAQASVFKISPLSEKQQQQMKKGNVWREGCPTPLSRLRTITLSFYDFEGKEHEDGEIVVLDAAANQVMAIFKELHAMKFPITKIKPIEDYHGEDEASLADNNSASFCCREIIGGGSPSMHGYGLAIDLNPIQNPYISFEQNGVFTTRILPPLGRDYINRRNMRPGMVETVVDVFKKNGFTVWGGNWNTPIDWQHFQPPRAVAQLLIAMSFEDAKEFFEMFTKAQPTLFNGIEPERNKFLEFYKQSPQKFMEVFRRDPNVFQLEAEEALKKLQ